MSLFGKCLISLTCCLHHYFPKVYTRRSRTQRRQPARSIYSVFHHIEASKQVPPSCFVAVPTVNWFTHIWCSLSFLSSHLMLFVTQPFHLSGLWDCTSRMLWGAPWRLHSIMCPNRTKKCSVFIQRSKSFSKWVMSLLPPPTLPPHPSQSDWSDMPQSQITLCSSHW